MSFSVKKHLLILLIFSAFFNSVAFAQTSVADTILKKDTSVNKIPGVNVRNYTTMRLITPKPVIDGKLDDECWSTGTWAGEFTQWIPVEGGKPTYPTEVNILYDDKNMYVAIARLMIRNLIKFSGSQV